jgi:hypothetical protein
VVGSSGGSGEAAAPFSESLSLFQSLQVLANEEEEMAFRNTTLGAGESQHFLREHRLGRR